MPKPKFILEDPQANRQWNLLKRRLQSAGKWTDEDEAAFSLLVDSYSRWLSVTAKIRELVGNPNVPDSGMILVNGRKGTIYRNPLMDVRAQLLGEVIRLCDRFGLTPLSRARLAAITRAADLPLFGETAGDGEIEQLGKGPDLDAAAAGG